MHLLKRILLRFNNLLLIKVRNYAHYSILRRPLRKISPARALQRKQAPAPRVAHGAFNFNRLSERLAQFALGRPRRQIKTLPPSNQGLAVRAAGGP